MRFIWNNYFEDTSNALTASDRYNSVYDVANIYDRRLAKKYRSAAFTNYMTYGDCEETTSPTLDGGTTGLSNATWARSAVQVYEGSYSWVLTKTSAAAAGDAENYLTDNTTTTDMHGLVAGYTYQLSTWIYTDVGTLANADVIIQEYYSGSWHDVLILNATGASAWEQIEGTFTLNENTTGVTLKLFIDTSEVVNKLMYLDDIRVYRENRIFLDARSGNTNQPTVCAIAGHNLSSNAVVRVEANATDDWTSPSYSQTITYNSDIMVYFISTSAYRYWSVVIQDPDNTAGYLQIGYMLIGEYLQATRGAARVFNIGGDDKSRVAEGESGQVLGSQGVLMKEFGLNIAYWTTAMVTSFDSMYDEIGNYRPWILVLDEDNLTKFGAKYVRFTGYPSFTHIHALDAYSAKLPIREAK